MGEQKNKMEQQKMVGEQVKGIAQGIIDGDFVLQFATIQNGYVLVKDPLDLRNPVKCIPGPDVILFVHMKKRVWPTVAVDDKGPDLQVIPPAGSN